MAKDVFGGLVGSRNKKEELILKCFKLIHNTIDHITKYSTMTYYPDITELKKLISKLENLNNYDKF